MAHPAQSMLPHLPTAEELPYDDGVPLESNRHRLQMNLSIDTLDLHWSGRRDYFAGGNMFIYFSEALRREDFRGPDVFVVLDVERGDRKSWVVWDEGRAPDVVIELTSDSTRSEDHGRKKDVYARQLRVPYYFIYDPDSAALWGGRLDTRTGWYVDLQPDDQARLPCEVLGLTLGVWQGEHRGFEAPWLRWFDAAGRMLPTGEELAASETARAEHEAARAEHEALLRREADARVAELEARLRALTDGSDEGP